MICTQNENVDRDGGIIKRTEPNRNSGAERSNNQVEKQ
jgi:hypothetical protein